MIQSNDLRTNTFMLIEAQSPVGYYPRDNIYNIGAPEERSKGLTKIKYLTK